jgi:hypothetical protein
MLNHNAVVPGHEIDRPLPIVVFKNSLLAWHHQHKAQQPNAELHSSNHISPFSRRRRRPLKLGNASG